MLCTATPSSAQSIEQLKRQREAERNPLSKFDSVGPFVDGVAIVYQGTKRGLVNEEGDVLLDCIYDQINTIGDDRYRVNKDGVYGCVTRTGQVIIPFLYNYIVEFNKAGIAQVRSNDKWGCIDINGNEIVPCIYNNLWYISSSGWIKVERDGKRGYYDTKGNLRVSCSYDRISDVSKEGLAWVAQGDKYGLYDAWENKALTPCAYTSMLIQPKVGSNTRQAVDFKKAPNTGGHHRYFVFDGIKWGLIDKKGKTITECQWDAISPMRFSRGWVSNNGKFGMLTDDGTTVLPCNIDIVQYRNGGSVKKYSDVNALADDNIKYVCAGGKWGMIDFQGKVLVPITYDKLGNYSCNRMLAMVDGKYGYIDEERRICIRLRYVCATDFSENIAAVKKEGDDKFYFINPNNRELFHIKADCVGLFRNGKCEIQKKDKTYYINTLGKKVK